jgi:ammonia channel protein AmtB
LRRKRVILLFKKFMIETLYVISDTELAVLEMSLILMALVGVTWTLWGYSLAFAPISVTDRKVKLGRAH